MAVNYATIFSPVIDQALVATLTSALMQADAADVKYEGGATIKIATFTTPGLGNYTRATGYPSGALSVDWNSYTFEKDRAIRMNIDKFDVDETNFVDTVANAVKVMRENDTDPEIDAYRYSKVFSSVAGASLLATPAPMAHYTPAAATILGKLQDDMTAVQDTVGETAPLVCYMSRQAYGILAKTDDLSRTLNALETTINGVKTKVKGLDDMPIIPVPSARMRTAYTYNDGASTYGFAAAATAGRINWIIAPRGALKAVVKGDEVKVIEPGVNQTFSGWSILFRLYHTLLVLDAKIPSMRIMDLVNTIAPACKTKFVGIRPGEKLHEVMIPVDDGRQTLEFKDHFIVRPAFSWWDVKWHGEKGGKPCPDGFYYGSDNNTDWLDEAELAKMIAELDLPEAKTWAAERGMATKRLKGKMIDK